VVAGKARQSKEGEVFCTAAIPPLSLHGGVAIPVFVGVGLVLTLVCHCMQPFRAGTSPAPTRRQRWAVIAKRSRSNLAIFQRGIATPPAGARNDKRAGTSPASTRRQRWAVIAKRSRSNLAIFQRGIATPPAGARNDKRAGTSHAPTRRQRWNVIARRSRSNLAIFQRGIATPPAGARNDKQAGTSPAPTRRSNLLERNQRSDSYTRGTRELIWQVTS